MQTLRVREANMFHRRVSSAVFALCNRGASGPVQEPEIDLFAEDIMPDRAL